MAIIISNYPQVKQEAYILYKIAGEPQGQFPNQISYHARIENLIDSIGLRSIVEVDARYLPLDEQVSAIQESHVGIFAYQNQSQSSSGTIPLVLSLGRPVLCTPFEYAKSKEDFGVTLTTDFDHLSIADAIEKFMARKEYLDITRDIYKNTRAWTWNKVGIAFSTEYKRIIKK